VRLRLIPILITIAVSSTVLFGGWFVYRSVAMEDPLIEQVEAIDGVAEATVDIGRNHVDLYVQLTQDASLAAVYPEIEDAASMLNGRDVRIQLSEEADKELDAWWSKALFDVAQAMDTMQYSVIPKRLEELAREQGGNLHIVSEIDDKNVYITLQNEQSIKYIVLPRRPVIMGVWPNE